MYNNQEYISANFTTESNLPKSPNYKKTLHKKNKIARKIVALGLSAVFFGGIAGGSFYGVNNLLEVSRHRGDRILFRAVIFPSPMCHIRPTHRVNLWMCRQLQNRDFPLLCQ